MISVWVINDRVIVLGLWFRLGLGSHTAADVGGSNFRGHKCPGRNLLQSCCQDSSYRRVSDSMSGCRLTISRRHHQESATSRGVFDRVRFWWSCHCRLRTEVRRSARGDNCSLPPVVISWIFSIPSSSIAVEFQSMPECSSLVDADVPAISSPARSPPRFVYSKQGSK